MVDLWTTSLPKDLFYQGPKVLQLFSLSIQLEAHSSSRYSILPAMSMDGILSVDIVEGSFDSMKFAHFIDGLLDRMSPYPGPNSVIVMDNCSIHKSPLVIEMIEERRASLYQAKVTF